MADDVRGWMEQLAQGEATAAQVVWERYFDSLVRLARRKLGNFPRRMADEEDIVVSVMDSFIEGARQRRYPQLEEENDLWRLLVVITARKAIKLRRKEFAAKRGHGNVGGESVLDGSDFNEGPGIGQVMGPEPTPEFAALMAEACRELLDQLEEPNLREVAQWRMEGYSNAEIAEKLQLSERSVERKVKDIRKFWTPPSDDAHGNQQPR